MKLNHPIIHMRIQIEICTTNHKQLEQHSGMISTWKEQTAIYDSTAAPPCGSTTTAEEEARCRQREEQLFVPGEGCHSNDNSWPKKSVRLCVFPIVLVHSAILLIDRTR